MQPNQIIYINYELALSCFFGKEGVNDGPPGMKGRLILQLSSTSGTFGQYETLTKKKDHLLFLPKSLTFMCSA